MLITGPWKGLRKVADKYRSFQELSQQEVLGRDYTILFSNEDSPVLIIAPHGGKIEPGTTELARAVAGDEWGFYSFYGIKILNTHRELHITSTNFDEPIALSMVVSSTRTVAIHGCKEDSGKIYLGGLDAELKEYIRRVLVAGGFAVSEHPKFPGTSRANICNRNRLGKGVQLEVAAGLRKLMFPGFPQRDRTTRYFDEFVRAVRSGITICMEKSEN
ncbi:poly-gamma-glutamate hydrolase family protein [Desulfallas sp. Bu1-1]|uniref:poly-gamma-glutamate hydrolase family protein n=1 Tax=Desulfallas sp. Bu1-1 TaxID=2787620 RepID=UPI00189C7250|nr:poly-gamma-glutamate hydrolase family protein [Desulfallas sp. Bu1-1]MBF7084590.1 poly-gamma-glutamate hydrolase family protein [Desulfallas sp. Bu1-1]